MKFTPAQWEAQKVLTGEARHLLLEGGSRSGKTFLIVRNIVTRAIKAPRSRHAILRYRFNACKNTIVADTFPKVMQVAYPEVPFTINRTDWFATVNDSEIWFGGLDDDERTEKILGMEFVTIFLNEISQIPYGSRGIALTRLAQKVMQENMQGMEDVPLKPRVFYDCNPPTKSHWGYKLFVRNLDPETNEPIPDAQNYARYRINPEDNAENISDDYLDTLRALPARLRNRFLKGEWADENPNQLFSDETLEKWRVLDGKLPDLVRIVIGVDPSGSGDADNADNDEIGIVVMGLGTDGCAYVLEDCTVKAGPATWGNVVASAFDRHGADVVVGEANYGGAMVQHTIQTARPRTPYKAVTATRGKHVRAEPISALYEKGKVRHVGTFQKLEGELTGFSTLGYVGQGSPNRADAAIWAASELFPSLVRKPVEKVKPSAPALTHSSWMAA